ncbi:ferredoxin-nitrate reductase [Solirubrobacter pauli]|uniref:Ferredoxin-nitrate reductase n=1 Tax=Solirubrobacter pauli TaxID=166793 RepID=A0A660LEE2_9ACTN|nr:ferredoxin-nitrate reductase [Solirubrobacter pauli]
MIRTGCPYCGVGCGLVAEVRDGRLAAVRGDEAHPVNAGRTCRKPLELPAAVHAGDRAVTPLLRGGTDERFHEASWDEALGHVAERLLAYRPDEIAFYISGQLLTEDYYAVNKLAKGYLRTNNVDSNSRLCMSSAVAAYDATFGADGPPPAYDDIELASTILLLGSNTSACHPILWGRIRAAQQAGATLIVVDPRRTDAAAVADIHLQLRPGTDLALLNAFIAGHELAGAWDAVTAAEVCGVPAVAIERAARAFADAPASLALWSMGANQSVEGTSINRALLNLCVVTGQIGRPGAGPLSLTGQPNAMGGRETGGLAHLLPGYRKVVREDHRAEVEAHWGLPAGTIDARPGLPATDLFDALEDGRVKAVWICATNPAVSMPDAERVRRALRKAELVIVQDAYHPTETGALAHVVLPSAQWPEKAGTSVSSERRIQLMRAAVDPPGEALADWQIFAGAAHHMGFDGFDWTDAAAVYDEFAALTAGRPCDQSGVSHARLEHGSLQWPCRSQTDPGTQRLYTDGRFPTETGRPNLQPALPGDPADPPDADHPLVLTTGRIATHWHTLTRTGKARELVAAEPEPFVTLHPDDAQRAWVQEGELAQVVSRRGAVKLRVRLDATLRPGTAFAPFHWGALHAPAGHGGVNDLTHQATDPVSRQPGLKATAVRVEPVAARRRRRTRHVLIIGGGPAGVKTAETILEHGDARITIAGDERGRPYDRVGLSDHLAGHRAATDLDLHPQRWYREHGITLCGTVVDVDTTLRVATLADGTQLAYDALVFATGSRPLLPPIDGIERATPFRTRHDVRTIRGRANGARRAVVIGGGLLGLEAARAIANRGIAVTVVHLADRLMERQLDATAGRMLERALRGQGIDVLCSTSTTRVLDGGVELADGTTIEAQLVVVAAGVVPEVLLAERIGLETDRGVLVDDSMRTSVPGVWAVGECAEHRGVTVGLVAPALAMARAAGADIAGQPAAYVPAPLSTKLKVAGIDLFCSGQLEGDDEAVQLDTRAGYYRREVYRGEQLVGEIVLGDPPVAAGAAPDPIVCACHRVTRSEIQAGRPGLAGTGCGSCADQVRSIREEAAQVGFQAVQAEGAEAVEVVMRGPVEVGRAGGDQPQLPRERV